MTLRKSVSGKHSTDKLDSLIQWALKEKIAGAFPPSEVWERIRVQAERSTVREQVRLDRGGYRTVVAQLFRGLSWGLSQVDACLFAQTVRAWNQNAWDERRFDSDFTYTRLLIEQCGVRLLLAF
jgi:hypothetical protein